MSELVKRRDVAHFGLKFMPLPLSAAKIGILKQTREKKADASLVAPSAFFSFFVFIAASYYCYKGYIL